MGKNENRPKDRGDIIFKVVGSFLAAAIVALLGILGNQALEKRHARDLQMRLYTELMSQREQAESSLRKDMFKSIIETFMKPATVTLEEKVLNLELLAYNFHESLNLKPLFLHLQRLMDRHPESIAADSSEIEDCRRRLIKVAREITGKQMLILKGVGKSFDREVEFYDDAGNAQFPVRLDTVTLELDSIRRHFCIEVFEFDQETREIEIEVEVWGDGEPYLNDFGDWAFRLPHDRQFPSLQRPTFCGDAGRIRRVKRFDYISLFPRTLRQS